MYMANNSASPFQPRPVAIAPAQDGRPSPQESNEEHFAYACVTCTRRKVKCDKLAPVCSTCKKAKLDCTYQEPARRSRKRKPATEEDILERLEHYEALLKQHGIETDTPAARPAGLRAPNVGSPLKNLQAPSGGPNAGQLLGGEGKSRYIDSSIWTNLGEHDLHPSSDEEDDDERMEPLSAVHSTPNTDPLSGSFLGGLPHGVNLLAKHPTYDHAMKLWNIYTTNIDPLVKVIHVPSALDMLQRAASNPSGISKATEALLFSIYHFSAVVVPDSDCEPLFGVSQPKLAALYHDAVRQALVNANFLKTTDIKLLQAYILFLLSVRTQYDPHTYWILTGVAARIGQRMGIQRDGDELGLQPFTTQMRRRIFWQLLPLDGMASQLSGTGIHLAQGQMWTTKPPLNVNDADIWPDMKEAPQPQVGATDIIFCRARTEMMTFIQNTEPPLPIFGPTTQIWDFKNTTAWEKQLDDLESMMETKYLRYLEFSNPLHNIVAAMARTAANSGRLRIRLGRAKALGDLSTEEKDELWNLAVKLIDYGISCRQNLNLAPFFWHLDGFFHWDALIWILNEMQREPLALQHNVIWDRIEKIYANQPKMLMQRRALHFALGQLTLRAWDAAQAALTPEQRALKFEPTYISSLRAYASKRGGATTSSGSGSASRASSSFPATLEYNPFDPQDPAESLNFGFSPATQDGSAAAAAAMWNTSLFDFNHTNWSATAEHPQPDTSVFDPMFWEEQRRQGMGLPMTRTGIL